MTPFLTRIFRISQKSYTAVYGQDSAMGVEVRAVRASLGASAGHRDRAQSLSEVQVAVLEPAQTGHQTTQEEGRSHLKDGETHEQSCPTTGSIRRSECNTVSDT